MFLVKKINVDFKKNMRKLLFSHSLSSHLEVEISGCDINLEVEIIWKCDWELALHME
jgi:hypothetical protein